MAASVSASTVPDVRPDRLAPRRTGRAAIGDRVGPLPGRAEAMTLARGSLSVG